MIDVKRQNSLILPNMRLPVGVMKQFYPPPAGTVLYLPGYPPLEATIYDKSGQSPPNNGTISGAVWKRLNSGLPYLDFDGTDDWVNLGVPASLNFLVTASFSAGGWWKYTTAGDVFMSRGDLASGAQNKILVLSCNGSSKAQTYFRDATGTSSIASSTSLVANTWYFIVFVRNYQVNWQIFLRGAGVSEDVTPVTDARAGITFTATRNLGIATRDQGYTTPLYYAIESALTFAATSVWTSALATSRFNQERHLFGV